MKHFEENHNQPIGSESICVILFLTKSYTRLKGYFKFNLVLLLDLKSLILLENVLRSVI
jgi:hypothetical protein